MIEDLKLMSRVQLGWGILIARACATSRVPEAFLAALIANESGGDAAKERFEFGVYRHLLDVQQDRAMRYGAIRKEHLIGLDDEALCLLATSRGLTQVMSYAAVFAHVDPLQLTDGPTCLNLTVHLLAKFADAYWLDPGRDFEDLFRCWNTGSPDGKTADPDYVVNGLKRIELYRAI